LLLSFAIVSDTARSNDFRFRDDRPGFLEGHHKFWGPRYQPLPHRMPLPRHWPRPGLDSVRRWNQIAIDASGLDHTPVEPGEDRVFGEQIGPGRSARAMAIVHIAMFDAIVAVVGGYES